MRRAAATIYLDLRRGLGTLATLASLAPLIGILGTLRAIAFDTFVGMGTERYTALAIVAEGISRACVPAALGLLVGLQSLWCYRYLQAEMEAFDREMVNASLWLAVEVQKASRLRQ